MYVNCRVGSLERNRKSQSKKSIVNCRVGSLEM